MTIARRVVELVLVASVVVIWFVAFRPQVLGGPAQYIVVRGSSMLPTYENGDLVIVHAAPSYAVGDVVAYRVPDGEVGAGHLVIHRLSGGSAAEGFEVKGDNNDWVDPWHPRQGDVAGRAWLAVPGLGRMLAFLHQPVTLGALAAALVVFLILARPAERDRGRDRVARIPGPILDDGPSLADEPSASA